MNHHQLANAHLKQRTRSVPERHRVQRTIRLPDAKPGDLPRFEFVDDQVVRRRTERAEPAEAVLESNVVICLDL
jgi:hypothetical protein